MIRSVLSPLVVDASVAIAISVGEPPGQALLRILGERRNAGGSLLVPTFFWLEVVNVLGLRYRMTPALLVEAVVDLEKLSLESTELDRPLLLLAIDAMAQHGLSGYDAAYLALAESADAQLLTLDVRLAAAAGRRALPIDDGHAIKESAEAYAPSWADWPGAAAYLRQLRAQVVRQANG
jgi:predicted nucleic acid-binding protein